MPEPRGRAARPLHIAWIGFAPTEEVGGVPGIANDLLHGLSALGHRVDCFFPSREQPLTPRVRGAENVTLVWGTSRWRWNTWYTRTRVTAFLSAQLLGGIASLRMRSEVMRRHRADPYDVVYQFSNVENRAAPRRLKRELPVVVHPGQSSADALRFLLRERRLSAGTRRSGVFAVTAAVLWFRSRMQRRQIRGATLVICISNVFREHLIRDYGLAREATVVVPNPVRLDRFAPAGRPPGSPPTVLVLGRIATGKGLEHVIAAARLLLERGTDVRFRLVGGTSVWSNYTRLLEDLPEENSEYAGPVPSTEVPAELARSDVLLQASKYEAFALTVAEALAAGVPVVATTEVGAIEQVDRTVAVATAPGDFEAMADGIEATLERLRRDPQATRAKARAEAERLFDPAVVCAAIGAALERLTARAGAPPAAQLADPAGAR